MHHAQGGVRRTNRQRGFFVQKGGQTVLEAAEEQGGRHPVIPQAGAVWNMQNEAPEEGLDPNSRAQGFDGRAETGIGTSGSDGLGIWDSSVQPILANGKGFCVSWYYGRGP